jgi:hypothetical protein
MRKLLLASLFSLASMHANASLLTFVPTSSVTFSGKNNVVNASTGMVGSLQANQAVTLTVTYLGYEAANINFLTLGTKLANSATNIATIGDTFVIDIGSGLVNIGFGGSGTFGYITNGASSIVSIDPTGTSYDYILGFNDGGSSDGDFDDYVIGLNAAPSLVPLPNALPLMAAAIGIFGMARRRYIG